MKAIYLLLSIFILASCSNNSLKPKKPYFLIGNWERLNNKPQHQTFETWNTNFTGLGFTLKEKDTTFKELLSIVNINDSLYLKVIGVNEKPTLFKFTNQTDSSFTCENPKNEFPTKIVYWLVADTLKASVSNKDFEIYFSFLKKEQ